MKANLSNYVESFKAFRKYYEEILKKDVPAESSHFVLPASAGETEEEKQKTKELEENMNFLAKLVDTAWRGNAVDTADLKKVIRLIVMLLRVIVPFDAEG